MSDSIGHELIRTYVRRNAIILIAQILIAARGLVLAPLLVKTFGTGVYGTYVLLVGFTGFVFGISGFGAGYRFSRHAPSTEDLAWRRSLFCGALLFNLITVTAIAAALLLTHPLLEAMILKRRFAFPIGPVVLLLISQTVFHHITNYFRYTHRIRTYVLISTAAAYAFMAVIYLTARAGVYLDVGQIILLQTGSILLVAPIPIILAARELWFPGGILERYDLREDLRVGLPVVAMFVVDYALSNSDRLLLGVFHTVESVGAYNAAYVVGTAAIVVPKALGVAVPPLLARAEDSSNRSDVSLLMSVSMRTVLLFSVPFVAGTVVYGWDVLALLMTDEVADMAYPAAVAVAAAIVFYGLFTVHGFLLYVKQRTVALFGATAAAAGLNLGAQCRVAAVLQEHPRSRAHHPGSLRRGLPDRAPCNRQRRRTYRPSVVPDSSGRSIGLDRRVPAARCSLGFAGRAGGMRDRLFPAVPGLAGSIRSDPQTRTLRRVPFAGRP